MPHRTRRRLHLRWKGVLVQSTNSPILALTTASPFTNVTIETREPTLRAGAASISRLAEQENANATFTAAMAAEIAMLRAHLTVTLVRSS